MAGRPNGAERVLAIAIVAGAIAMAVVLFTTREGPGATVDSGEYLAVADGLRHGHGLTMGYVGYDEPYPERVRPGERVDMTQFPPLLPVAVAAVGTVSHSSPLVAVRWLNAVALGLVVALGVALVGR